LTDTEKKAEARLTMRETIAYLHKAYGVVVTRHEIMRMVEADDLPYCRPLSTGRYWFRRGDIDNAWAPRLDSEHGQPTIQ